MAFSQGMIQQQILFTNELVIGALISKQLTSGQRNLA
jgi:hypothetical protein